MTRLGAAPLLLFWALPLLAGLAMLLPAAGDSEAWRMALAHPQLWPALALSLGTGAISTLLALALTLTLLAGLYRSRLWYSLQSLAAAGLAIPHLAFAIGFGFLVMPSGLLARLVIGGEAPPQWVTVQDPWGLTLSLALALKELPFLLTAGLGILSRGDAALRLRQACRAAASLGHSPGSAFLRVVLPPLLKDLRWPLVIVFVYGATVVDMALVLGPTQPPTLAVVIWHALNDVDTAMNGMGLAMVLLLTAALALLLGGVALVLRQAHGPLHRLLTVGPSSLRAPRGLAALVGAFALAILVLAMVVLVILSLAPRWPYPALLPPAADGAAWMKVTAAPLWLSLTLSLAAAITAVMLAMMWFETQAPSRDRWVIGLALVALALPQMASAGGQYRLFLPLGLTGTLAGLFLAHLTPVAAYVLIVLAGPWRSFDGRYVAAGRALSASRMRALLAVKLPLLKAPLLTAAAIGFAVSIAQYVPAQLIAAGRFSTLPMEAVTLAAGGNRALTAAFALALAAPPLIAFLAAALLGRPRWR
ncbi:ABC transporter permease [Aestuariivirga litoralis]|uniref:ABC transporter permease n=1 Tax=Aestuariivirga litoralis TaxID=2650924 RepID=A0A2W2B8C9_9HYPH|nr:ABC transporter permease [Aestuariivirga litoralis]PZF76554.1 ABC transporter permease [Aestuariivirga litoralis]